MSVAQPTLSAEQIGPSDISNSLHNSRFAHYLAQTLQVGLQHPDDKRKTASAYQADQNVVLMQEFRARQMSLQHRHYPGQMNPPRKTSSEYKRELGALKDNFEAKQKLIEKMTKMMHDMIDLSEEHAFLCEVQGWNNRTYLQLVDASRQVHPYHPPVSQHLYLPAPAPVSQHLSLPAPAPGARSLEDGMSALVVSQGGGSSMHFDV
jgi:hypothetical protein